MSIAMILAHDCGLAVPCLTFATVEDAEAFLIDVIGADGRDDSGRWGTGLREADHYRISRSFFTEYYGGSVAVNHYSIVEVEHGKPFVGWDLD